MTNRFRELMVVPASIAGLCLGVYLAPSPAGSIGSPSTGPPSAWAQDPLQQSQLLADITERAMDSVVSIRAMRSPSSAREPAVLFPFLPPSRPSPALGTGSGVMIGDGSTIVTNHHVVAGADVIEVQFADQSTTRARLVGTDEATDLAVLQVDPPGQRAGLRFGDSTRLRRGELVLALGNPFGLSGSASLGIVSATGRANMGITDYEDFIQTDAAINPGNSGGALVNMHGQLVGINTAIFSRSGGSQGIGFAIPAHMVEEVVDALLRDGQVRRGWLGVSVRDVGDKVRTAHDRPELQGVEIRGIESGTPAAQAGLRPGDIVVAIDEQPVADTTTFRQRIARAGVDTTVTLAVVRGSDRVQVPVRLAERPSESARRRR